ncbi:unnamed protein product [Kluyveromyces dobzhanskii CBS 2104]|uniref:Golgi to ER traffic protein 2 n=1 Tax=Kluyveromyces dobzhanskii CBS 2104 TaxID=1427455 RepID=A0A0A8L4G3_9SACH|nr:unnamed protein product [Kluyveromyces dobzhanskii CBS 2104]
MTTELSDAEKRKLLRERRQQKFSNGGASNRLNKITGQQQSSFLTSKSVLDEAKPASPVSKKQTNLNNKEVEASTKEIQDLLSRIPDNNSNSEPDVGETNPEVALFQQLLKMQQQGGGFPNSGSPGTSTPDLFSSLLNNDTSTTASASQLFPNFVDEEVLRYYKSTVSKLKSYIILLKWAILVPYVYFLVHPNLTILNSSSLVSHLLERSNFFSVFTAMEVVFISIYYQMLKKLQKKNNVTATQNAGGILKYLTMIPEGILPIKNVQGKIGLALEYFDVASMYVTDICLALVLFGVMKYFHSSSSISVPTEAPVLQAN